VDECKPLVPGEVALVDKWVAFDAEQLAPPAAVVVNMLTNKTAFDKHAFDDAMKVGPGRHRGVIGVSSGCHRGVIGGS